MSRSCAVVVAVVTSVLVLASPALAIDQTVSWGVGPGHTGFAMGSALSAPPLTARWSRNLGNSMTQPLVADGKVFVSYADPSKSGSTVAALDAITGATVWWRPAPGYVYLAYEGGRLYLSDTAGTMTGVDATTGATLWTRSLMEPFDTSIPVAYDGYVYIGLSWSGGTLYALNGRDGTTAWTAPISDGGSPAVAGDSVYLSHDYYCGASSYNRKTGAKNWTTAPDCWPGVNWAIADGSRVLTSQYILDSSSGSVKDTFVATKFPALAGNTGVFPNNKVLQGRDLTTGVGRWELTLPATITSSPVVVNGVAYAGASDGKLYAADLASGQMVWSTQAGPSGSSVGGPGLAVGEGSLYVPVGGTITAYSGDSLQLPDGRDVSITSGPNGPSASSSATFTFTANGGGFEYRCRIDNLAWQPCAGAQTYSGLRDGPHVFEVKTVRAQTGEDIGVAARGFSVDTVAPVTTLTGGPASPTRSTSATFTLKTSEPGTTECRLDGGAWTACSSSKSVSGLGDGDHVFEARTRDSAGNVEEPPAQRAWTVDTRAPDARVTSGPEGTTSSGSAAFEFTSSDAGARFDCSIDTTSGAQPCSSPKSYSGLTDGRHTFYVRAVDPAGNASAWATYVWTIDRRSPDTTITTGPTGTSGSAQATFEFRSDETASRFECRLDGAAFGPCSSPQTYSNLSEGEHTFEVRAVDAGGNVDTTPATRTWEVDAVPPPDTQAPETTIDSGPAGTTRAPNAEFRISVDDPGARIECSLDGEPWSDCASTTVRTELADGAHEFQARGVDDAGNVDPTPATRTWTIDTTAPQTTIDAERSGAAGSAAARFEFQADEPSSTFECQMDDGPWEACTSPVSYTGLTTGGHTFRVQATDPWGNRDLTAATLGFVLAKAVAPTSTGAGGSGVKSPQAATSPDTGDSSAGAAGGAGDAPLTHEGQSTPSPSAPETPASARSLVAALTDRIDELVPALAAGKRPAFGYRARSKGTLAVEVWVRRAGRNILAAKARRTFRRAGVASVRIVPTRAGRDALRARSGRVTVKATFKPARRARAR